MSSQRVTRIEKVRLREAAEWVQRLADRNEPDDVFLEWQSWYKLDPANAQAFEQVQEVWQVLKPARVARVTSITKKKQGVSLALAASIIVVVGAASVWFYATFAGPQALNTGIGEVRQVTLTDGSRLDLGADSRVVIRYSDNQRLLELTKGRALFTVARDPARPFIVQAGEFRVTAVGTAFDIRTAPASTVITVSEGRVKIAARDTRATATASQLVPPVLAVAGQRLRYSKSGSVPTVSHIDSRLTESWRHGILQFQEEPLHDVVSEVNRYSARKIVIDGSDIGQTSFTGTIATDRVDDWLAALETIIPVTVEDRGRGGIHIVHSVSPAEGR